ncbi:N(4)-acetylcytidine aminohydrolase [Shewanella gelidimarina]|uniref:N(4)-acetylcytidine aminohydrolase n=1 Tax=Shewanella gelidimarina TaxID=56813 RepID=UPI00200F007D|nr:N(4)-acetylcytidine aminohydrolase [Shewanella gelidimarina]MCL1059135.1 N(4)-acetylcytidine aminohydrolase [Shewanella gelidimarina]
MQTITFFQRFENDILAGRKTITLRDKSESHFEAGETVNVANLETATCYGQLHILSVAWVKFDDLNSLHAQQENMTLVELKTLIREIYPEIQALYQINFKLL